MRGSPSNAPSLIATSASLKGSPLNSADPQLAQNTFGLPDAGGENARSESDPLSSVKSPWATRQLTDDPVPVRFRQWVQWQ